MFSGQSFSQFSFGEQDFPQPDSSAFESFLAEATSARCWLLEIDALSLASAPSLSGTFSAAGFSEVSFGEDAGGVTGGVTTLRFSTHGYTSLAADNPARTWYDGRLSDSVMADRRITGKDGIGGLATIYAEVALANADGGLDTLTANYAIDGRPARILIGRETDALSDYGLYFSGVVASAVIGTDDVQLKLSDGQAKLAVPLNSTTYLGTGGTEGGADLKGKPKPKAYGHIKGVTPPLVDTVNLIYQVNDGPISDVPYAYDRGIALAKVVGAPAPAQYQVDTTAGTITLGARPSGTFTCDVLGDASLSGYINRASDIVLRVLVAQAGLVSTEIEPSSFVQLNTDAPAEVGIWAGTEGRTIADVADELLRNGGAFGGFNRQGAFSVAVLAAANGTPKATFTEEDIIEITREPLPPAVEPVAWRTTVGYQKNYTVQTDLAAAVPAAQLIFASQPVRVSKSEDAAIKSRHLLACEYADDTGLYAQSADSDAEALRRFTLWSAGRKLLRVKLRPVALTRDMGQVVQLQHRRHGLSLGAPARIIGHTARGTEVELLVLV